MFSLASFRKKAASSSLDSIRISPRMPIGSSSETEEVELSLLSEEERASAGRDGDAQIHADATKTTAMSSSDKKAVILLIILCRSLSYVFAFN